MSSEEEALDAYSNAVITVAERPEFLPRLYHELALEAFEDIPTPRKVEITLEQWESEWLNWPEATFVAVAGGEIIGMAGLNYDASVPPRPAPGPPAI